MCSCHCPADNVVAATIVSLDNACVSSIEVNQALWTVVSHLNVAMKIYFYLIPGTSQDLTRGSFRKNYAPDGQQRVRVSVSMTTTEAMVIVRR